MSNNMIFYNSETHEVLNSFLEERFSTRDTSGERVVNIHTIDPERVEIRDGKIVKFYTAEEIEQRRQAKYDQETDEILRIIDSRPRAPYTPEPIEEVYTMPTPPRPSIPVPSAQTRPKTTAEKREQLKQKSKTPTKYFSKRNRDREIEIAKKVVIAVAGVLLTIGITIGGARLADEMEYKTDHVTVNQATAVLLDQTPERYSPDIVDKNTTYNHQTNKYWYDNQDIGKDLLKLPDKTFDANLYLVYALMGNNASNGYKNNFDEVIRYVAQNADEQNHPMAYLRCNGCSDLEDLLIKNGFVDSQGSPSLEAFKKFGRAMTSVYAEYLDELADEYKDEYNKGLK